MKRMKKKVVAMVTLAMFMMTLLPMAAFALPEKYIDASQSTVEVTPTTPVEVNENITVTVDLKEAAKDINDAAYNNLYVWFESEDGEVYKQVNMKGENARIDGNSAVAFNKDGDTVVSFTKAGTYELKAGVSDVSADKVIDTAKELTPVAIENSTVEVKAPATDVSAITTNTTQNAPKVIKADGDTRNVIPVQLTGTKFPEGTVLKIDNTAADSGLVFVDNAGKIVTEYAVEDTTNPTVNLLLVADKSAVAGTYEIGLQCGEAKATLYVKVKDGVVADKVAATIEAEPVDKALVSKNNTDTDIKDVKFVVKNAAGEALDVTDSEPMVADIQKDGAVIFAHDKFVSVTGPSKVEASDVTFGYEDGAMYLKLNDQFKNVFKKAGEYSVTATLKNGQSATATFNVVEKVGAVESIEIVPVKEKEALVLNGDAAEFEVVAYDKDGLKVGLTDPTNNLKVAYTPVAKDVVLTTGTNQEKGTVAAKLKTDADKNEVLGTKVNVLAVYTVDKQDFVAEYEYTIVDKSQYELADYELVFDKTEGTVLSYNKVKPSVVNQDKTKKIKNLYVNKLSQTNSDAKVSVSENNKNIVIYSDKDTSVDVQVIALVETKTGLAKFAGTLTYKIGAPTPEETANTTVVMTFGSNEMIVNNEVVTIDKAAPFAQDNRTFVPFRALGEALGAKVEYVAADNTVTYSLGKTEIVMTLDSKDYTVNGAKKTMDVAPFAKEGRTYVPVRFVGEALGFNVTALQNGAGQYVGVAFTK